MKNASLAAVILTLAISPAQAQKPYSGKAISLAHGEELFVAPTNGSEKQCSAQVLYWTSTSGSSFQRSPNLGWYQLFGYLRTCVNDQELVRMSVDEIIDLAACLDTRNYNGSLFISCFTDEPRS